ncbi:DUF1501 domain-containing protein [Fulvivirga sedimenti]|uniref:DUF1501 domain-containing protein n=1 Tax=Fulvivirga sedimenti TaxID=2879465 RepID=A0A9X1HYW2_9BACT|nr:DUF1501 domain-containing protein [Fulvivirga sedimenti]MCA6079147.1 DUF1501 domain-containing protein [Fulvivirga sedimenti]
MKRRSFLNRIPLMAGASFALQHVPIRVMSQHSPFMRLAGQSTNDRVIIILQMHGGNDGLNTFIPVEQYDLYYSRRANIAIPAKNSIRSMIPLDSTLPYADQVGLHPDLIGMKDMYDRGRMAIVQGVSYPNNNGSHFRGRDIWHMGGGPDDYFSSGWVGRYLQQDIAPMQYPDEFPNAACPDPLAIEMGSDVSLIFHQNNNIPLSISLGSNPEALANLVGELEGFTDEGFDPRGKPPSFLDDSPYGKEMNWILGLEDKSEDYAARLYEIYSRSSPTQVSYPEVYPFNAPASSLRNRLTPQLQMIARLLDGGGAGQGVKTKVFLVKIGGFDTHASQVESYDPTMGSHAALLYHISSAMRAFQEDLRVRGLENKVLTLTTSEFGRRIGSNGSYGTDHGTGAPMMLFGAGVNPGVYGTNPDVTQNNVQMQFDYRQIYANILKDWMQVDEQVINNDIFFGDFIQGPKPDGGNYEPIPLARQEITSNEAFFSERFRLEKAYPNPARDYTNIRYRINSPADVKLTLYDIQGRPVKILVDEHREPGDHEVKVHLDDVPAGIYIYEIAAGILKDSKRLIVRK